MADGRTLELRLKVESHDTISTGEFIDLFRCAEDVARHLVEHEARFLLDYLDVPTESRLSSLQRLHRLGRRAPVPAEVESVQRGSWIVIVTIASPAVLWFLKSYVDPVVREAWDGSALRSRVLRFLQDKAFGGARKAVEQKAVTSPRYGNLQIVDVSEQGARSGEFDGVTIRLERRIILAVPKDQADAIERFFEDSPNQP